MHSLIIHVTVLLLYRLAMVALPRVQLEKALILGLEFLVLGISCKKDTIVTSVFIMQLTFHQLFLSKEIAPSKVSTLMPLF